MASKKVADKVIKRLWERYVKGATLRDLASARGVTPEAISYLFKTRGFKKSALRKCALPECEEMFLPATSRHRCCCRQHVKRLHAREAKGLKRSVVPCALPECNEMVVQMHRGDRPSLAMRSGEGKRFCCRKHADVAHSRRRNGWYKKLLDQRHGCAAPGCAERVVIDQHHVEFSGTKSNKKSKTYYLCPTHHMAIHRSTAEIRDGKYVNLVPDLLRAIEQKKEIYHGYEKSLDPSRFTKRPKDRRKK